MPYEPPGTRPLEPDGNDPFGPTRPLRRASRPAPQPTAVLRPPPSPTRALPADPWAGRPPVDDPVPAPPADRRPDGRRARRGRGFSLLVLALAVGAALVLGWSTYAALAAVNLAAADPFGAALEWATVAGVAALAAVAIFLLGVGALLVSRPRTTAAVATLAAVVLPVTAGGLAVWFGVGLAVQNAGYDVTNYGAAVALFVLRTAEAFGVDLGPLHDVLAGWAPSGA